MIMSKSVVRRNPSREMCEQTIRRILSTEVMQLGENRHFRSASDFMNYFESLYPASDALTKQVQRAVKAMNMAKDEKGFFLVDKTVDQAEQEKVLSGVFENAHVTVDAMDGCETVFLSCDGPMREYLIYMMDSSEDLRGKYLTAVSASNGVILYTRCKSKLLEALNSLTI
jgi:hypothetical protein